MEKKSLVGLTPDDREGGVPTKCQVTNFTKSIEKGMLLKRKNDHTGKGGGVTNLQRICLVLFEYPSR